MRSLPAILLAFLLAGCSGPIQLVDAEDGEPVQPDVAGVDVPSTFDNLTPKLPESSTDFQPFSVGEDALDLPGDGFMEFRTGRGMHCHGDADPVAPNATGWVACAVRLAADPDAAAQGVHELGVGQDSTRLSLRMASEPVEWRLFVVVLNGNASSLAYDSGWRAVDLSPSIADPILSIEVVDPCDFPNAQEQPMLGGPRGQAKLTLESSARHGRVSVAVDTSRSHPTASSPGPTDVQTVGDHMYIGMWSVIGSPRRIELGLEVDLEASEAPDGSAADTTCGAVVSRETQEWTILLAIAGADGRVINFVRTVSVDVALAVQP